AGESKTPSDEKQCTWPELLGKAALLEGSNRRHDLVRPGQRSRMTVLARQPEMRRRADGQVQTGEDDEDLPPGKPGFEADRQRPEDRRGKAGNQRQEDDEPSRR